MHIRDTVISMTLMHVCYHTGLQNLEILLIVHRSFADVEPSSSMHTHDSPNHQLLWVVLHSGCSWTDAIGATSSRTHGDIKKWIHHRTLPENATIFARHLRDQAGDISISSKTEGLLCYYYLNFTMFNKAFMQELNKSFETYLKLI